MVLLSAHFSREELACGCCGRCEIKPELLSLLEAIRKEWGGSLIVNSGYRCPLHNKAVGGAPGSKHLTGEAADIRSERIEDADLLWGVVRGLHRAGRLPLLGGLGRYDGRIHVDVARAPDGHLREWDLRSSK